MSRIVSLGAALLNVILADHDNFAITTGGAGVNAAVTFARYGHETILMSTIARDAAGEAVIRTLDDENIDSSYVEFAPGATGCSVVLLDENTSERNTMDYAGVSLDASRLSPSALNDISPDWLYASSLGGDMQRLCDFFEKAHSLGAKVMFNPGAAELANPSQLIGLLQDTDVLLVNKYEASQIVPGVILSELLAHLSNYCPVVLITDGIMGAIASDRHQIFRLGVYEQTRTRDVTGAGDAFGAGFLAEYAESGDFERALRFASANASKVTEHYGAEEGIIPRDYDLHPMPIELVRTEESVKPRKRKEKK